jgi:predicted TIM-barrel fold metal-dependent hydrolase
MLIIDFHAHITAPGIIARRDEYLIRDAWFRDLYANPKARLSSAEDLISAMDRDSVDQAVVFGFGWRDMDLCQRDNDYVIEAVTRYPDRLVGFAIVNPQNGAEAVREIERCAAAGLRGVGELMPDGQGYRLDDEKVMAPIVEVTTDRKLVLLTHCSEPVGHLYPGKGTVTPDEVIRFARLFPNATLVCAHWGGGTIFYELMPDVARVMGNVYYDTAASLFLYQDDIFSLAARLAPGKVLFATDFPLITPGRFFQRIRAARIPTATRRRMLGGNAWRVLKLGEQKRADDDGWTRAPHPETAGRQPADVAAVTHRRSD